MPALLQGLNALFGRHPRAFLQPGLDYPPVSAGSKPKPPLVEAADAPARQALHLWALPGGTVAPEGANAPPAPLPTKAQAQAAAAQACAAEIARLLAAGQAGQCTLGGRPLQGGDIAVLVRSHRQGSLMRQALTDLGVASVELSQDSVFDSPDADALLRLLMALLQPGQEAVLRAALATELMGWTADRLLQLDADENTLLAVVLQFQQWHSLWQQRGIARWLRQWLEEAQVASRLLQRPDGERRLTNLLHLGEVLQAAAAEHHSPEALLRWFQGQRGREGGGSEEAQLRLESDRHLVQVVTIHKSKGLEYAIVFCPFLWDGGRLQPSSGGDGLAYHDDEGRAVIDFHPTPQVADAAQRLALAAAAEQLRLLYVALTRAVHRCHVVVGGHGRGKRLDSSAKAWLNWLVAGGAFDSAAQWLAPGPTLAQVVAAWQALADSTPEAIALEPLPLAPGQPLPAQRPAAASLQALPAPSRMSQPWWVGSYSGLVQSRGAKAEHPHQRAAADHDALVPTAASPGAAASVPSTSALAEATAQLPPDDILAFPRGATAGQCLHRLFELADFAQPTQWPSAVQQALAEQPPEDGRSPRRQRPEQLQAAMLQMLQDVLHSPLPVLPATGTPHTRDTFTLAEVPAGQRLAELEFHLPSSRLSDRGLVALLAPYGYRLPALDFGTLKGYLRGFIDLVFQHQGRWYILDWKSNHLGGSALHYGAAPLQAAMDEHAYTLQYLLYTVALHRWLQTRLPGYRYEEHMGGVLYLFVRGVRPGWRQADGPWAGHTAGVVADRPPLACIEALAALLQPAPATPFTAKPAEPAHPGDR
jgi:exodeoxyribonuclease V beta subunit